MNADNAIPFSLDLLVVARLAAANVDEYLYLSAEVETLIGARIDQIRQNIEDELATFSEREREELSDHFYWDVRQYDAIFPSMHRQAMFVALYNYLEHNLNLLCRGIGEDLNSDIRLKDLNGRGVKRALLYLTRVASLDLSAASGALKFVNRANELRNAIVHNGGVLPEDASHSVVLLLGEEPSLTGTPGSYINLGEEFLARFGSEVKLLFKVVEAAMYHLRGDEVLPT